MVVKNDDLRILHDIFLWHTFGDHGEELEAAIIHRNKKEIELSSVNQTFWTFGMGSKGRMVDRWRQHLSKQSPGGHAYVVLGGKGNRGENVKSQVATHYTENVLKGKSGWKQVPDFIKATWKDLTSKGSMALVVSEITVVKEDSELKVSWWNQSKQEWSPECPSQQTRDGVKLLKKTLNGKPITSNADCRYILKLEDPYFVKVKKSV
jgi:hypothetical protein